MSKRFAIKALAAAAVLALSLGTAGQMGPCLRDLRGLPHAVGLGRRRDQKTQQWQVRHPGFPSL